MAAAVAAFAASATMDGPVEAQEQRITCGEFYQVQPGDTLREIAVQAYAVGNYQVIFDANRNTLSTPSLLLVGQRLFIPCLDGRGPSTREEAEARIVQDSGTDLLRPPELSRGALALPAPLPQPSEEELFGTEETETAAVSGGGGLSGVQPGIGTVQPGIGTVQPGIAGVQPASGPVAGTGARAIAGIQPGAGGAAAPAGVQPQPGGGATAGSGARAIAGIQPGAGGLQPAPGAGGAQPPAGTGTAETAIAGIQPGAGGSAAASGIQPAPGTGGIQPSPGTGGIQPAPGAGTPQPQPGSGATAIAGIQPGAGGVAAPSGIQPQPGAGGAGITGIQPAPGGGSGLQGGLAAGIQPSPGTDARLAARTVPSSAPRPQAQPAPGRPARNVGAGTDNRLVSPQARPLPDAPAVAIAAGSAATAAATGQPMRLLSGPLPPYSGEQLPENGMLSDVVSRAIEAAAPGKGTQIFFVEDWSVHLSVLLPTGAFDLGYPWFRPNCAEMERLSAEMQLRCTAYNFSEPLHELLVGYFVRRGSDLVRISGPDGLAGRSLCRPEGSAMFDLDQRGLSAPTVTIVQLPTSADCLRAMVAGEVDVVSLGVSEFDAEVGRLGISGQVDEIAALADLLTLHVISPKSSPTGLDSLALIDEGLAAMRQTGEWFQVVARHMTELSPGQ